MSKGSPHDCKSTPVSYEQHAQYSFFFMFFILFFSFCFFPSVLSLAHCPTPRVQIILCVTVYVYTCFRFSFTVAVQTAWMDTETGPIPSGRRQRRATLFRTPAVYHLLKAVAAAATPQIYMKLWVQCSLSMIIIIIHFYRALFSAPKQPCCTHLTCDCELVECYFTSTETIGLLGMGWFWRSDCILLIVFFPSNVHQSGMLTLLCGSYMAAPAFGLSAHISDTYRCSV